MRVRPLENVSENQGQVTRDRVGAAEPAAFAAEPGRPVTRKADRLSCLRFGAARYSVTVRLIGETVGLRTDRKITDPQTGWAPMSAQFHGEPARDD